jgi:hypothetical protein
MGSDPQSGARRAVIAGASNASTIVAFIRATTIVIFVVIVPAVAALGATVLDTDT